MFVLVILILKIKLLPTKEQAVALLDTIRAANLACNSISETAWGTQVYNKIKLHHLVYHPLRASTTLSSQTLVRCIGKVAAAYKVQKKTQAVFKPFGAITYDSRILTYDTDSVSIWTTSGRCKIPISCHDAPKFSRKKGEADLLYKNGKFFLAQSIEIPDTLVAAASQYLGVDLGITDIAVTSEGVKYSSAQLNSYREKRQNIRSSIQSKGTKGAKKLLKRLAGKERTTATIINHTISKAIVKCAKEKGMGIAMENLKGVQSVAKSKYMRTQLGRWSFYQLRQFITYKAALSGVPVIIVNPAYTSQTCSYCGNMGVRKAKVFDCPTCSHHEDADLNAAKNIAFIGASISMPEKPSTLAQV
jgi:putative transposase